MSIAIAGFLMGLSLIVAIGPQNALIIRQGVKREGVLAVLLVCIISDVILIFGGTAGVGALVERAPVALVALKWLGAAYLSCTSALAVGGTLLNDVATPSLWKNQSPSTPKAPKCIPSNTAALA